MRDGDLKVYLDCKRCGRPIPEPFTRLSGPVYRRHDPGPNNASCHLVVTPDPEGEDHRQVVVAAPQDPKTPTIEDVLDEEVERWLEEREEEAQATAHRVGRHLSEAFDELEQEVASLAARGGA